MTKAGNVTKFIPCQLNCTSIDIFLNFSRYKLGGCNKHLCQPIDWISNTVLAPTRTGLHPNRYIALNWGCPNKLLSAPCALDYDHVLVVAVEADGETQSMLRSASRRASFCCKERDNHSFHQARKTLSFSLSLSLYLFQCNPAKLITLFADCVSACVCVSVCVCVCVCGRGKFTK